MPFTPITPEYLLNRKYAYDDKDIDAGRSYRRKFKRGTVSVTFLNFHDSDGVFITVTIGKNTLSLSRMYKQTEFFDKVEEFVS